MEDMVIKNEFDHSYLVIEEKEDIKKSYDYKMITGNQIPGFIHCKERHEEDRACLYYDITSKKTLEKEYADKQMTFTQIYELFYQMNLLLKVAGNYLLKGENIVFHPAYLYIDLETEQLSLLYIPFATDFCENGSFSENIRGRYHSLADFFLDKINHKDEHAVNVAYQFYKISKEDFFSFEAFLSFLDKEKGMSEAEERLALKQSSESVIPSYAEPDEYIPDSGFREQTSGTGENKRKGFLLPVILFCGAALLVAGYMLPFFRLYRRYFLAGAVILLSIAGIRIAGTLFAYFKETREKRYEADHQEMVVSVDDYFGYEENGETVFFDESANLKDKLLLKWTEAGIPREYQSADYPFLIGKKKEAVDMFIDEVSVSRLHAKIYREKERLYIQDLNSTNGTFVNEERIKADIKVVIQMQDSIRIGKVLIKLI